MQKDCRNNPCLAHQTRAAEGRSYASCTHGTRTSGNCSSTAVPDAVLPPPSMESCVALTSYLPVGRLYIALSLREVCSFCPLKQAERGAQAKLSPKGRERGEADQDKGPVNLCPAERARHGWRALDLPARAGKVERSKSRVRPRVYGYALGAPPETSA